MGSALRRVFSDVARSVEEFPLMHMVALLLFALLMLIQLLLSLLALFLGIYALVVVKTGELPEQFWIGEALVAGGSVLMLWLACIGVRKLWGIAKRKHPNLQKPSS